MRRRPVIIAALVIAALAGAFPPWRLTVPGRSRPAGLHFVLAPPSPWGVWQPRVDVARLVIIWLVLASVTGVALIVPVPARRPRSPAAPELPDAPPQFPAPDRRPDALPDRPHWSP